MKCSYDLSLTFEAENSEQAMAGILPRTPVLKARESLPEIGRLSNNRRVHSLRTRPHKAVTMIMVGCSLLKQPSRSSTLGEELILGNGRNTVSRVLFRRRELTEFCGKLGEFCEKLGEFAFALRNRIRPVPDIRMEPPHTHVFGNDR